MIGHLIKIENRFWLIALFLCFAVDAFCIMNNTLPLMVVLYICVLLFCGIFVYQRLISAIRFIQKERDKLNKKLISMKKTILILLVLLTSCKGIAPLAPLKVERVEKSGDRYLYYLTSLENKHRYLQLYSEKKFFVGDTVEIQKIKK